MTDTRHPWPSQIPRLHVDGPTATITLSRPVQRNRLERSDLAELLHLFAQVDSNPSVRVLVLAADTRGQPQPVFCAGFDLGGFADDAQASSGFEPVPEALVGLRPITVCALNGSVYGGATDLALACDLRLGLIGSTWKMPAAALGLHYYPSGLRRAVATLGLPLAQRCFLTAAPIPFEDLHQQSGCFVDLVAPGAFDAALGALVQQVASLAPLATQWTKQSLNEIALGIADDAVLKSREQRSAASADFAEGRAAQATRRTPHFRGA